VGGEETGVDVPCAYLGMYRVDFPRGEGVWSAGDPLATR